MFYLNEIKIFEKHVCKSNIQSYKVADVYLYPIFRREIIEKYLRSTTDFNAFNFRKRGKWNTFVSVLKSFYTISSLLNLFKVGKRDFIFVGFSRREKEQDGTYFDKFHDPIIDTVGPESCLMLEKPFNLGHCEKRYTKSAVIDLDLIIYFSLFLSVLAAPFVFIFNKRSIEGFSNSVKSKLQVNLTKLKISVAVSNFAIQRWVSACIFRRLSAKKLVVTSRWLHYPFIYSAKDLGIEVIELQHGAILNVNTFYNNFEERQGSADAMFVFSEYWLEKNWNVGRVHATGRYAGIVDQHKPLVNEKAHSNNKSILVISQPELSSYLNCDLKKIAIRNPDCKFYVKLHPQDIDGYKTRYSDIFSCENIEFIADRTINIIDSVTNYSLVLGYNSTVLFECLGKGTPVGLIHNLSFDEPTYEELFGRGYRYFEKVFVNEKIGWQFKCQNFKNPFFSSFNSSFIESYFNEKVS